MSVQTPLARHLEDLIRRRGPIRFDEYMDLALYHPVHGYYSRSEGTPIGANGDFYTSASLDPAMGRLLAKLFAAMSEEIEGFLLVEIGAGTGRLLRDVLETRPFPCLIVERSQAMRERQREALEGFEVEWVDRLPSGLTGCVFSNEFFDALPVRRFVRRGGELREVFVAGGLSEIEAEPEMAVELPLLEDGCRAEVCREAPDWILRIGAALRSGYHLTIDYGYRRREFFSQRSGTLMCYRRHRGDEDPYSSPGEKDITAHVNFSDLIDAGAEADLHLAGFRSQRDFLIDLGILDLLESLAGRRDAGSIRRLQSLKTLLLPSGMGDRFKVLLQRKGLGPRELPGFRGPASA